MKPINFSNKWINTTIHIIIWLVVFSLPFILYKTNTRPRHEITDKEITEFQYVGICTNFLWVGAFYLNALILIPKLVYKKKITRYFISIIFLFFICILLHYFIFSLIVNRNHFSFWNGLQFNLAPYLLSIAISTIWQMWSDKVRSEKLLMEKKQETLKTELSFLRSQISPHFFLNVLNNVVALVRMKSDNLEPTVMKLSSLMKYMLYETNEEKVLLKSEAEYLQSYIDLQQQRFGKKVKVSVTINIDNDWYEIEPMLLIPFVENAFKHGVGLIENPQIKINLQIINQLLTFSVENKFNGTVAEVKDKTSGIGLVNVQRRLNLLYSTDHTLFIEKNNDWFKVVLTINLHQ
jgi:sensor histidine kinase YesM